MRTDEWLSPQDLADELDVSVHTVYGWRYKKPPKGPRAHKVGKHLRFRRADVDAWLADNAEASPEVA